MSRSDAPAHADGVGAFRFRLLGTRFEVICPREVGAAIAPYLPSGAVHEDPATASAVVTVHGDDAHCSLRLDDGRDAGAAGTAALVERLFAVASERAWSDAAGWGRLSAATVDLPAGRTLLLSGAGGGRTTAALAFMAAGLSTRGDATVAIRDGAAWPATQVFTPWMNALGLIDQQMRGAGAPPAVRPLPGRRSIVTPADFGREWRIGAAPVRALIFLAPDPCRLSRLTPIGPLEAVRRLHAFGDRNGMDGGAWVRQLCRLVEAPAAVLRFGETVSAVAAVRRFTEGPIAMETAA